MDLEEVTVYLNNIKDSLKNKITNFDCYLFGSVLTSDYPNDIDLLILYLNREDIFVFKSYIKALSLKFPLHFTYLTYTEEKQFNFIKEQKAKKIFSL